MKHPLIFILFLILWGRYIGAQPQLPKFKEASPLWTYQLSHDYLKDADGNPVAGNLGVLSPTRTLIKDSFMISMNGTASYLDLTSAIDGFIVTKINLYTGKVEWKDVFNIYNGADGFFTFGYYSQFDKNGNLELLGGRKIINQNTAPLTMSFRRVYDFDTGEVLEFHYDPQNKVQIPDRKGDDIFPVNGDSSYLNFYFRTFGWPDTTRYMMVGALFNKTMDSLINPELFKMEYDPGFKVDVFSLKSFLFRNINDSVTVAHVAFREAKPQLYGLYHKLLFINHKDLNNIHISKVKDLSGIVEFNLLYPRNYELEIRNGEILLQDFETVYPGPDAIPWVWRIDAEGNDIDFLYDVQVDGSEYNNLYFLNEKDSLTYLLCYPSKKSLQGFDIITKHKNGEVSFLASVTLDTDNPQQNYGQSRLSRFLVNDSILVYNGSFNDRSDPYNGARWLMTFNLNDLIRGSSVNTTNVVESSHQIKIYPNPSKGFFTVDIPAPWQNKDVLLELSDVTGKKVWSDLRKNTRHAESFDVTFVPTGIYFGRCVYDKDMPQVFTLIIE